MARRRPAPASLPMRVLTPHRSRRASEALLLLMLIRSVFNDWRLLADEGLLAELASTPMQAALPNGVCRVLEAIYSEEEPAGAEERGEGTEFLLFLTYTDRLLDVDLPGDEAGAFRGAPLMERRRSASGRYGCRSEESR